MDRRAVHRAELWAGAVTAVKGSVCCLGGGGLVPGALGRMEWGWRGEERQETGYRSDLRWQREVLSTMLKRTGFALAAVVSCGSGKSLGNENGQIHAA